MDPKNIIKPVKLENDLEWKDVREGTPPPFTTCLVLAGSRVPILRQFMKRKFAKGSKPVTHYVVLYYTDAPWEQRNKI